MNDIELKIKAIVAINTNKKDSEKVLGGVLGKGSGEGFSGSRGSRQILRVIFSFVSSVLGTANRSNIKNHIIRGPPTGLT